MGLLAEEKTHLTELQTFIILLGDNLNLSAFTEHWEVRLTHQSQNPRENKCETRQNTLNLLASRGILGNVGNKVLTRKNV